MQTQSKQNKATRPLLNIENLVLLSKSWLTKYLKGLAKNQEGYWSRWVNLK